MSITMTPAYGRDYKTAKAAKESWYGGDDWIVNDLTNRWDGKPASYRDIPEMVRLRFDDLKKVCAA